MAIAHSPVTFYHWKAKTEKFETLTAKWSTQADWSTWAELDCILQSKQHVKYWCTHMCRKCPNFPKSKFYHRTVFTSDFTSTTLNTSIYTPLSDRMVQTLSQIPKIYYLHILKILYHGSKSVIPLVKMLLFFIIILIIWFALLLHSSCMNATHLIKTNHVIQHKLGWSK